MPKIILFIDFDGTLTLKPGQKTVFSEFYQVLLQKPVGKKNYKEVPLKDSSEVQTIIKNRLLTDYLDSKETNYLMTPEAVNFLHEVLKNKEISVNIITKNRGDYIQEILKFQGFSTDEIGQINISDSGYKFNDVQRILKPLNMEEVSSIYIFDDSPNDYENMKEAATKWKKAAKKQGNNVHVKGKNKETGHFEWTSYLEKINEELGLAESFSNPRYRANPFTAIVYFDFDNNMLINFPIYKLNQTPFYQSLLFGYKEGEMQDEWDTEFKDSPTIQNALNEKFGPYDGISNFSSKDAKFLIPPKTIEFLRKLLNQENIKIRIITQNRKEYILELLKYQGVTENEIKQLTIKADPSNRYTTAHNDIFELSATLKLHQCFFYIFEDKDDEDLDIENAIKDYHKDRNVCVNNLNAISMESKDFNGENFLTTIQSTANPNVVVYAFFNQEKSILIPLNLTKCLHSLLNIENIDLRILTSSTQKKAKEALRQQNFTALEIEQLTILSIGENNKDLAEKLTESLEELLKSGKEIFQFYVFASPAATYNQIEEIINKKYPNKKIDGTCRQGEILETIMSDVVKTFSTTRQKNQPQDLPTQLTGGSFRLWTKHKPEVQEGTSTGVGLLI